MLFSETEQAVSGCGETIWKEPKLCCRSARRRACLIWFESIGCFLHSSLRRKNSPVVPKGFAIFSGYSIQYFWVGINMVFSLLVGGLGGGFCVGDDGTGGG
ncbi:unnamed protein product [Brassica oleracea]|uniref:(rape) hypothetical protein n=1 Tax=Brassica napus TaxID=3708 RepID=A0A816V3S0_BRANA|nr:unnamed protein product [Brassica napus]